MPRTPQLVCQHLENISGGVLEDYQDIIRECVSRRQGVSGPYTVITMISSVRSSSVQPSCEERFLRAEGGTARRERVGTGVDLNAGSGSRINFSGHRRLATEMSSSIASQ